MSDPHDEWLAKIRQRGVARSGPDPSRRDCRCPGRPGPPPGEAAHDGRDSVGKVKRARAGRCSGALQLQQTYVARVNRTPAAKSDAGGLGAPMLRGPVEGWIYRQGGGCGIRALRTGARHRSQQCPRPDGVGDPVLRVGFERWARYPTAQNPQTPTALAPDPAELAGPRYLPPTPRGVQPVAADN